MRRRARVLLCAAALAGGAGAAALSGVAEGIPVAEAAEAPVMPATSPPPRAPPGAREPDPVQHLAFEPLVFEPDGDAFGRRFRDGMPITGATPHRIILFTFDDGPDPRHTPRLLDHLDAVGVRAVFFLTASRMRGDNAWERANQRIARDIVRRGHLIGNHTLDHAQLPILPDAQVRHQVIEAERIIEQVLGERPWLFRHPGGARSERVDRLVAERGYTPVLWNIGTGDFLVRTPNEVLGTWRRVLERRTTDHGDQGGVILLHDTHEWSVEAFPRIVEEIRRRNCALVEQGEDVELYDIVDDPALFFVPRADAPPHLDAPAALPDPAVLAARQDRLRGETRRRCTSLAQ